MNQLMEQIKESLKSSRFEHTMGVMYTAASLAMCYGENINQAMKAGLLHDCAKGMSGEQLITYCQQNLIFMSAAEKENPELLHAKVGTYLAQHKYGVTDEYILNAITYHTTGRPNMTMLDKIIYVADYIEPHRNKAPNLDVFRQLAYKDLDACLCEILNATLTYLKSENKIIDSKTEETYNFYNKKG